MGVIAPGKARPWPLLHHIICLSLLFLLSSSFPAGAREVVLKTDQEGPFHLDRISWLRDSNRDLDVGEVLARYHADEFSSASRYPSLGFTRDRIWFAFSARQDNGPQTWLLMLSPAFIDHVHLYQHTAGRWLDHGAQGKHNPEEDASWLWRRPVYEVSVSEEPSIFLVAVESRTNIALDPHFWQQGSLIRFSIREMAGIGVLFGVALILAVLSLVFFIILRRRFFLFYFLYLFSFTAMMMIIEGVIHHYLQPAEPIHLEWLQPPLQALFLLSLVYLFIAITDEQPGDRQHPRRLHLMSWVLTIAALSPLLIGNLELSIALLWFMLLVLASLMPLLALRLRSRLGSTAWLYAAAFALVAVAAFSRLVWVFGLVPMNPVSTLMPFVSIPLHIVLLFVALALRYAQHQAAARRTRERMLEMSAAAEQQLEAQVEHRTLELRSALDESERSARALASTRDQLRTALDTEKEATLAQRRFMRMVAHEFRSPLSVIDTATSMLELHPSPSREQMEKSCDHIRRATQCLTTLVEQSLNEEKLDKLNWQKNAAWHDLAELLEEAMDFARLVSEGRHHLELALSCHSRLQGDRALLLTLFRNLLDNAIKYSLEGSPIQVSLCRDEQGRAVVAVTDRGKGISEEELDRVLDKYYRSADAGDIAGIGLGLYLVDRIARLHDAELVLESRPDRGTRALVFFPAESIMEPDA